MGRYGRAALRGMDIDDAQDKLEVEHRLVLGVFTLDAFAEPHEKTTC